MKKIFLTIFFTFISTFSFSNEIITLKCKQTNFAEIYELDFTNKMIKFISFPNIPPRMFEYTNNDIIFFHFFINTVKKINYVNKYSVDRSTGNMFENQYVLNDQQFEYAKNLNIPEAQKYFYSLTPLPGTEHFLCEKTNTIKAF